jgi:ribonuclease-3
MKNKFSSLEKKIHIVFKDRDLLENVFIHRSFLNEHKNYHLSSNEKLEFLGDSVISLVTSIYLYRHYPDLDEGTYTDIKASIVRTESLAEVAKKINLGNYIALSNGEELNKGKENKNILADCFEALVAAVFIDKNFEDAYLFIGEFLFKYKLDYIVKNKLYLSPKSRLQELLQAQYRVLPVYVIEKEEGPEHKKQFSVSVYCKEKKMGEGFGHSKKEAEEAAAKNALEKMII